MKLSYNITIPLGLLFLIILSTSCKKFLDEKPDTKLSVPTTLADARALLEYNPVMSSNATADEVSADNYYLTQQHYNSMEEEGHKRMYTWEPDHMFDNYLNNWFTEYRKVYSCNLVLECLENISPTALEQTEWNTLKGQALMIRAKTFLAIANIWCLAYDATDADNQLGIPLRLSSDFNQAVGRGNLEQTYQQIVNDLKTAIPLLPAAGMNAAYASRAAGYAYLSRTFLAMRHYPEAGRYADSCLQLNSALIDYNTISVTAAVPFPQFHAEHLYYGFAWSRHLDISIAKLDSTLYPQFHNDDLRKKIYFKMNADGTHAFKGGYAGTATNLFAGIATDEIYLTRAECFARQGNKDSALLYLNRLLVKRFMTGTFVPVTATDAAGALTIILAERRKELIMRFTRWIDIKRLNKEGAGIILTRKMNNQVYTLPPNDLRYALPIPEEIVRISGIPQNPR